MKSKMFVLRRAARLEYLDAVRWYRNQDSELGKRFFEAVDELFSAVVANPEQFPIVEADVRKAVIQHFPYNIFFRVSNSRIVILAVFHSSRNPRVWQSRR